MNEVQRERALKFRVGVFVLFAVLAFLGAIYALGARARLFEVRYTIYADFTQVGGLAEGATVRLAGVQIGRVIDVSLPAEPGGKVRVAMSIAKQYANRIRKTSVARIATQGLLGDKIVEITVGTADAPAVQAGEAIATRDPFEMGDAIAESAGTIKSITALAEALRKTAESLNQSGVIEHASETVKTAQRLTERFGRIADQVEQGRGWAHALLYEEPVALRRLKGLLAAFLFDPKYRAILDDVRDATHNFRVISERVVGGRGTLGSLTKDEADDGGLRVAIQDLRTALANMKQITERINEGEGTIGALIADPTVYEQLVSILEGAQRSSILRFLIRNLGKGKKE